MRTLWVSAVAWLPLAAAAQWSSFDARDHQVVDPFAVSACSDAASQEVRSRMPSAGSVKVTRADGSVAGESRVDVSGDGSFAGAGGQAQTFTFRCSYDTKARTTSGVTVLL
ncbi:hypothetical protein FIV34_09730 [Luteibacter pinisoli]|uniref:DUF4156 domain-containing protein n=1 Tax=Luteibacter pinisoli TaxID=2589080 RepID=A0A4Y5Z2C3_9GAMM|nr:hypothetical protein [Luteibacter pinisoli]QDE39462.1 hypothetical protein FIV34_09730 [Luteibacter pinisoli]